MKKKKIDSVKVKKLANKSGLNGLIYNPDLPEGWENLDYTEKTIMFQKLFLLLNDDYQKEFGAEIYSAVSKLGYFESDSDWLIIKNLGSSYFAEGEFNSQGKDVVKLCKAITKLLTGKKDEYLDIDATVETIYWLNKLLELTGLHDQLIAKAPSLSLIGDIRELKKQTEANRKSAFIELSRQEQRAIRILNRLTIEMLFPLKTPESQSISLFPRVGILSAGCLRFRVKSDAAQYRCEGKKMFTAGEFYETLISRDLIKHPPDRLQLNIAHIIKRVTGSTVCEEVDMSRVIHDSDFYYDPGDFETRKKDAIKEFENYLTVREAEKRGDPNVLLPEIIYPMVQIRRAKKDLMGDFEKMVDRLQKSLFEQSPEKMLPELGHRKMKRDKKGKPREHPVDYNNIARFYRIYVLLKLGVDKVELVLYEYPKLGLPDPANEEEREALLRKDVERARALIKNARTSDFPGPY
ncbi:MAG: hypothetical protein ABSB95_01045 [Dissulfurispiraceae bacterium]|jgi:hypothetical protein